MRITAISFFDAFHICVTIIPNLFIAGSADTLMDAEATAAASGLAHGVGCALVIACQEIGAPAIELVTTFGHALEIMITIVVVKFLAK